MKHSVMLCCVCAVKYWILTHRGLILFSLQTPGMNIPQKTATIGMTVISVIVLIYLLSGIFWWTLLSSGVLVALHALLRDASMHKELFLAEADEENSPEANSKSI
jgi:hypothetical protein